ncbi:ent-kaurene oxidase [Astrocystis sublimbata]|nr:ent-kaurene oxidase [Astrocystis sublimbata]
MAAYLLCILTAPFALVIASVYTWHWMSPFYSRYNDLLHSQPIVGYRKGWWGWPLATLRSVYKSKQWSDEGYNKYSKAGVPFTMPSIERGAAVIIPPRQLKSVYGLPENVLGVQAAQDQTLQVDWTIWDKRVTDVRFHISVIRHQMTKNLKQLTPAIADELERGFEEWWGTETKWRELSIWDSCFKLVAGASNRAFCGIPLCRDVDFLQRLRDHALAIFLGGAAINATPELLRPVVGFVTGLLCEFLFRRALKKCLPVVRERLEKTTMLKSYPDYSWIPPSDSLQWIIEESRACGDSHQLSPEVICKRLLLINDISLHTTSFTVHNLILDLVSSDPSKCYIEALREECARVFEEAGGSWTFEAINKLKLVDSAIRESIRFTPITSVGLPRTVIHPNGIQLDGFGAKIPYGTTIATPMEAIHFDEDIYKNSRQFDAFRFAHPEAVRNVLDTFSDNDHSRDKSSLNQKPKSSLSLDDAFVGFGFGKHGCPGRYFALNEMKIFVAHMLLNYDLGTVQKRPQLIDVLWLKLPFHGAKVRVRRRITAPPSN